MEVGEEEKGEEGRGVGLYRRQCGVGEDKSDSHG